MNSTTTFLGVVGLAIVGPLVLAVVFAGVMSWLSRRVPAGTQAAEPAPVAKARKPTAPTRPAPAVPEPPPQVETAEVEPFVTEAAGLEREETHRRLVPAWLVAVYAIVIVWALVYILMEVVPFFKLLTP